MNRIYTIVILIGISMNSCFKDEGNYTYDAIGEIEISNIEESYLKYSYVGDVLEIPAVVTTDYADMEYAWYIWEGTGTSYEEEKQEMQLIGEDKELSYEVNLAPGDYTVMLKATSATNGYSALQTTHLEVSTQFLRGFYVLKETAEGNTELDLHYQDGQPLVENMLAITGQEELAGKPLAVAPLYLQGYIDKETNKVEECNAIAVTTEQGNIAFYNTEDFQMVHENSDVVYGGLGANIMPYVAYSDMFYNYILTSEGVYSVQTGYTPSSAYAYDNNVNVEGGSRFITSYWVDMWGMPMNGTFYWDNQNQCISYFDGYGGMIFGPYSENAEGMNCLMCGFTRSNSMAYFLLENTQGRHLYEISVDVNMSSISTNAKIDLPASSKLAKATCYAVNADNANYLYYVYDNKLYAYSLSERDEGTTPLSLPEIPSDEEIAYLSYQWMNCTADAESGTNFTHLVVGTQKGDTYKVYMYDLAGGEPQTLVRTITGTGKVKSVVYISPRFQPMSDTASLPN